MLSLGDGDYNNDAPLPEEATKYFKLYFCHDREISNNLANFN